MLKPARVAGTRRKRSLLRRPSPGDEAVSGPCIYLERISDSHTPSTLTRVNSSYAVLARDRIQLETKSAGTAHSVLMLQLGSAASLAPVRKSPAT